MRRFLHLEVGDPHLEKFFRAIARHAAEGVVHFEKPALCVDDEEAVHRTAQDRAVPRGQLVQPRRGLFLIRHVAKGHGRGGGSLLRRAQGHNVRHDAAVADLKAMEASFLAVNCTL